MDTPLRAARRKSGQNLAEVAQALGTDAGNLSRIERGIQAPSREMAEKLARHFRRFKLTEIQIIYPERFADPSLQEAG